MLIDGLEDDVQNAIFGSDYCNIMLENIASQPGYYNMISKQQLNGQYLTENPHFNRYSSSVHQSFAETKQ